MKILLVSVLLSAGGTAAAIHKMDVAEAGKAQQAQQVLRWIAEANRRQDSGGYITGRVVPGHALSKAPGVQDLDWNAQAYDFFAADNPDSCIVAKATRKTEGPNGTTLNRYAKLGFCANQQGVVASLDEDGTCHLDCLVDSVSALSAGLPSFGTAAQ